MINLNGLGVAMVTPFNENGSVDYPEGEVNTYTTDGDGFLGLCEGEIGEGISYNVEVKNEGFIGTPRINK